MDIMTDSDAAYLDMLGREEISPKEIPEVPKKRGRKPKAAKQPEEKKPEEKKPEQAAAQKKPGRKPKTEKQLAETAEQIATDTMDKAIDKAAEREEAIRFLIQIAKGRTKEIVRTAEHSIDNGKKLIEMAEIYQQHIRIAEEMIE